MYPDAETSRYFRNYEAQRKYAPFFSSQTQLDFFLRIPVATNERDEFLHNLIRESKLDKDSEEAAQIDRVLDGITEEDEDPHCGTEETSTPHPSPT
jgi:hypothetical protein